MGRRRKADWWLVTAEAEGNGARMIQDGTTNKRGCSLRRSTAYWLLVRSKPEDGRKIGDAGGAGWAQARTVKLEDSGEALALFSFEDEARMFVWCGTAEAGWHPRKTTPEELLQMLAGPHSTAGFVALDPLPEAIFMGMAPLVSLSRECVVDLLTKRVKNEKATPLGS